MYVSTGAMPGASVLSSGQAARCTVACQHAQTRTWVLIAGDPSGGNSTLVTIAATTARLLQANYRRFLNQVW
jgi:hypothetical protein